MDVEKYIATKMTSSEKRGYQRKRASREYHNDHRNMPPVSARSAQELRSAQVVLAGWALEQDEPQAWLGDVLSALGLHRKV